MKRLVPLLLVVAVGCATTPSTESGWRITETRIESTARIASLLMFSELEENYGLYSQQSLAFARSCQIANETSILLSAGEIPDASQWASVTSLVDAMFGVAYAQELVTAESIALVRSLMDQVPGEARARLWVALFLQTAADTALKQYEGKGVGQ